MSPELSNHNPNRTGQGAELAAQSAPEGAALGAQPKESAPRKRLRRRLGALRRGAARPGVIATTLWAVLAFYGVQVALVVFLQALGLIQSQLTNNIELFIVQGLAQLLTVAAVVGIVRHYRLTLADLGLSGPVFQQFGKVLGVFLLYMLASVVFSATVGSLLQIDFDQQQDLGFSRPQGAELALVFITLVLVTPVVEELVFRGFLFRAYRRRFGFVLGAVLVSVLFALVHGQWNVGLDVFVLSLAACYLRESTGSLWPPIMLHGVKNLLAFTVLFGFNFF